MTHNFFVYFLTEFLPPSPLVPITGVGEEPWLLTHSGETLLIEKIMLLRHEKSRRQWIHLLSSVLISRNQNRKMIAPNTLHLNYLAKMAQPGFLSFLHFWMCSTMLEVEQAEESGSKL